MSVAPPEASKQPVATANSSSVSSSSVDKKVADKNSQEIAKPDANKREQNKQRNREAILSAGQSVFIEIGYDACTVRDIIGRTQLAPGTFYNYFPDKRSVLLALANQMSAEGRKRTRQARARGNTIPEIVHNGFRAYFEFIANDPQRFELLRRNSAALRTLGIDETGFKDGVDDIRLDIERALANTKTSAHQLDKLPIAYLTRALGALAFEIGAQMSEADEPDVQGATDFATLFSLTGILGIAQENDISTD